MGDVTESSTATAPLTDRSPEELAAFADEQRRAYDALAASGLKLDLTRGKPAAAQLDLSEDLLSLPRGHQDAAGVDTRNYGGLEGIAELRAMFAELLGVESDQVVAGGNSSLVMMREVLVDLWLHGGVDSERPWSREDKVTFICPVPGYDRHFTLLEWFGIDMVTVPMHDDVEHARGQPEERERQRLERRQDADLERRRVKEERRRERERQERDVPAEVGDRERAPELHEVRVAPQAGDPPAGVHLLQDRCHCSSFRHFVTVKATYAVAEREAERQPVGSNRPSRLESGGMSARGIRTRKRVPECAPTPRAKSRVSGRCWCRGCALEACRWVIGSHEV